MNLRSWRAAAWAFGASFSFVAGGTALAAAPGTMQVAGALAAAGGGPVADGAYDVKFALYAADTGGVALWQESATTVAVKAGQFALMIGEKTAIAPKTAAAGTLWLGVAVGGEPELPRRPLGSVAFALRTNVAEGLDCSGCVGSAQLDAAALTGLVKTADLAKVATSGNFADLAGVPSLEPYAKLSKLADVASSGQYADLLGTPKLAPVANSADYNDLKNVPVLAKIGTQCGSGLYVTGLAKDGSLQCAAGYDPTKQLFQFTVAPTAPKQCAPELLGSAYVGDKDLTLYICNGTAWFPISIGGYGTKGLPGKSCKDILQSAPGSKDGLYYIAIGGLPNQVYCDMTSDGGGWTLVNYAYRPQNGGTDVYYLPNAANGTWDPAGRSGKASIDATTLLQTASQVLLTVTNNGTAPVIGNALSYELAYRWPKASGYNKFTLTDAVTTCITVSVTELKTNSTFDAKTFDDRPQLSCSGHKGGTLYERQFIGFNSATCYGACGSDPVTSNGMVVWYGDGYTPTTSGGKSDPARAASWGFWMR